MDNKLTYTKVGDYYIPNLTAEPMLSRDLGSVHISQVMWQNKTMKLNQEQYEKNSNCFPRQRKPAKISNLDVLNAVLYLGENGCKWRGLPKEYEDWHVIYVRVNRWAKKGVLQAVFLQLQQGHHPN